jgi:4,5-dihydroxyphthalate decarboxylase
MAIATAARQDVVTLHTLLQDKPWNMPLKRGEIQSSIVQFDFDDIEEASDHFKPMVREMAYDCGELAIVTYLQARTYNKAWVLLPFVVTGNFHHKSIAYNAEKGDLRPADLAGRGVGVRTYSQTTGVWVRGILQNEYGVDLDKVTWARSDDEHVLEFVPPRNVDDLGEGEDLTDLPFIVGDLTGGYHVPLIADADDAAERALRRGLWPVNHTLVVKDELLAAHPDLGRSLLVALDRAKELYLASGELEPLHARVREITGSDPMPYGVEPNRAVLEQLLDHVVAQKIVRRRPSVDELFRHI